MKNIPKKQFVGWMLMLLLCISSSAFAQSPKKVTGRVMDAQGELLIGVNVTEAADPSNGVVTDINGTYTITLKGNKPSLKFSEVGFKDKVGGVGSKGVLDVAVEEDVKKLIADAAAFGGGKIDVIVNAAGVISLQDMMHTTTEEVQRLFNINVVGTVHMIKHGLAHLEANKGGNMILVSSIAGRDGMGMLQTYSASKAAVTSLMQSAAKHAAPYGVRVNAILPGIIRTAMWEEILEGMNNGWDPEVHNELTPEKREELWNASVKSMIPLGHDQKEEDIAWATVFLASDFAREITSQALCIDGGTTSGR